MSQKKILFNLIYPTKDIGGGWNYIENFIAAIFSNKKSKDYEFFALCNEESVKLVKDFLPTENVDVCISVKDSKKYLKRIYYENVYTKTFIANKSIDIQHWFGNVASPISKTCNHIVIHDFLFWKNFRENIARTLYQMTLFKVNSYMGNNFYLPISNKTKKDLKEITNSKGNVINIIPNALDDNYGKISIEDVDNFKRKFNLNYEFILFVSHTYKHKNHLSLVKAYKSYKNNGGNRKLVLRGDKINNYSSIENAIKDSELEDDIVWLPRLSNLEMQCLYKSATFMIFPSLYEGGGIPLMEAFACECPVACSSLNVFKNFYNDIPYYFDPNKVESILNAIKVMDESIRLRNKISQQGLKHVEKFRYNIISDKILNGYKLKFEEE